MTTPQKKPPGQTWESFAEQKMREAIEAGEFANLPGFGQPIADIDEPWDENSWVRKKLQSERMQLLPPILEARLRIQKLREELPAIGLESEVRRRVAALNEYIRQAHFSHVAGPAEGVMPLEVEQVLAEWRALLGREGD